MHIGHILATLSCFIQGCYLHCSLAQQLILFHLLDDYLYRQQSRGSYDLASVVIYWLTGLDLKRWLYCTMKTTKWMRHSYNIKLIYNCDLIELT